TVTAPGLTAAYVDVFTLEPGKSKTDLAPKLGGDGFTVRGVVRDQKGAPVAGAMIHALRFSEVEGDIFLAETDAAGAYRITVPKADYNILAIAPGLEGAPRNLRGAEDRTIDFQLTRAYPRDTKAPPEVLAWLKQAAIPLSTALAGHGFAD